MSTHELDALKLARADIPTPEEAMKWFEDLQAGWVYKGDPKKPHAKLHSGKCSDGFFLCKRVLSHGNLRELLAACIIRRLRNSGLFMEEVGGVFGSPYSSIMLAADVGRLLGVKTYVPEKDPTDPAGKRMVFKSDDPIPAGTNLLQIEELVTTFDSGDETKRAIIKGSQFGVSFVPFVGVLVYRPPKIEYDLPDGRTIVPFIERIVNAWDPSECPLCKDGSVPLAPKTNWAELTA